MGHSSLAKGSLPSRNRDNPKIWRPTFWFWLFCTLFDMGLVYKKKKSRPFNVVAAPRSSLAPVQAWPPFKVGPQALNGGYPSH